MWRMRHIPQNEEIRQNFEDLEEYLGDPIWLPLPYARGAGTGNWTDFVAGEAQRGEYTLKEGWVHIRGFVRNETAYAFPATNTLVATLPKGFRPGFVEAFTVWQKDTGNSMSVMPVAILTNGSVQLTLGNSDFVGTNNGTASYIALGNIAFRQVN